MKDSANKKPGKPLSKERILTAGLELADEIGVDSLSMRKLAERLGVQAMSLYNHIGSRDEIIEGIVDRVVGEIEIPDIDDDWKNAMRRRAHSAHTVLLRHPWAVLALISQSNAGPAMLRYVDATIGCLRKAGFSFAETDHAWNTMDNHIYGFTLRELNFPFEPSEYSHVASEFLPKIRVKDYPFFSGLAREIIAGRHSGVSDFNFGLDLIIDGLDRLRKNRRS